MRIKCRIQILVFFITIGVFMSCKKDEVETPLTVSPATVSFPDAGGTSEITITSNKSWRISNAASAWLQLGPTTGDSGTATIQLTAGRNSTGSTRSNILTLNFGIFDRKNIVVFNKPILDALVEKANP